MIGTLYDDFTINLFVLDLHRHAETLKFAQTMKACLTKVEKNPRSRERSRNKVEDR